MKQSRRFLSCVFLVAAIFTLQKVSAIESLNSMDIDSFGYSNTEEAQQFWKPVDQGGPPIEVTSIAEDTAVEFSAPFLSQSDKPRFSIDRNVALDLSKMTSTSLQVRGNGENVSTQVSVYFRSGSGWFSGGAFLNQSGWRQITISKDRFVPEGNPTGWDQIDGVRISVWPNKKNRRDTSFNLKSLKASWNNIAIILPDSEEKGFKSADAIAKRMEAMLRDIGVGADRLSVTSMKGGALGDRPLAILPNNSKLDEKSIFVLERYVSAGGKLFTSYSVPQSVSEMLGFKKGQYYGEENPGDFASIRFDADDIPGLPQEVKQASWNIITAEPVDYNARVIGYWMNAEGKPMEKPAMLISDRGAFFSHILLGDDSKNKKEMLTAVLGKLNPELWAEAYRGARINSEKIGHFKSLGELEEFVGNGPGEKKMTESSAAMLASGKLFEEGAVFDSYRLSLRARDLRAEAYVLSHPSKDIEARAFWNHTGTGAYPGDWERTAREMSAAGLNMILPNMLWGGQAHYPSEVLPRSKTFERHGDQIAQCVEACKKHDVEVHVWKVCFNLGYGILQEYVDQLRKENRLQVSVDGEPGDWLNPAHPKNFQMELDAILEVVKNYDIDGFHFDYIRYPGSDNDFSEYSREKFEADTGHKVKNWPADCHKGLLTEAYTDWRCGNITRLVKAVSEQARKIKPDIKISAAVFRDYPNCRKWVAQDWPLWAKEGYVDFLCPMDYTDDDEKYIDWITTQKSQLPEGFPLYPGIGVSLRNKTQGGDRVIGQVFLNRKVETGGFTVFDLNQSTLKNVTEAMSMSAGNTKAIPPHRNPTK